METNKGNAYKTNRNDTPTHTAGSLSGVEFLEQIEQDYGVAEIEAIKTAISFFEINGDAGAPQLGELIENLESAILAIQTHVLPESHPMAVN